MPYIAGTPVMPYIQDIKQGVTHMTTLTPGTKVRTLYHFPMTGVIVKPKKINLPLPSPDWYIFQADPEHVVPGHTGRHCIHRNMIAVRNDH